MLNALEPLCSVGGESWSGGLLGLKEGHPTEREPGLNLSLDQLSGLAAPDSNGLTLALMVNHHALASSEDGSLAMVFQGRNAPQGDGWSPIQAFIVSVRGEGQVSQPEPVPSDQKSGSYRALAMGTGGRIFVGWTESTEQGSAIVLCRGRREGSS